MAGTAQGTVDSLLGRLSSVLIDEAQLLGGVRGDVRFIKDEMEIMNGFLLDLANANPNNQLRAWIKQVRELANDSQNCVDRYVQSLASRHSVGILGSLQRVAQLVRTMPTRHRIAVQIQELKARAREVGERRLRYGIIVPHVTEDKDKASTGPKEEEEEEDDAAAERRAQADVSEFFKCEEREVIGWLTETLGDGHPQRWLRVIAVIRRLSQEKEYSLARRVHDHPCASSWFDFKTWIDRIEKDTPRKLLLQHILEKLPAVGGEEEAAIDTLHEELLLKKLEGRLKGKKFLIVAADDPFGLVRKEIESACSSLPNGDRSPGSAIIVGAGKEPPETDVYKSKNYLYLDNFCGRAVDLAGEHGKHQVKIMQQILRKCNGSLFCMEMFLRALYVNPNMTKEELLELRDGLVVPSGRWTIQGRLISRELARRMTMLFYHDLPSQYKRCLLYLSIFPKEKSIKRACLVRRWAAQGLITERDGMSATDEAERCFKALVARGLVRPANIGAAGKVRTCTVPTLVHFVITNMARDDGLVDRDLPPDWTCGLSIWDGVKLQQLTDKDANAAEHSNTCWNIRKRPTPTDLKGSKVPLESLDATVTFLESLPTSSLPRLVKVLDLEGCKGLKRHHLKNICNKNIFQLRYLSLRNTDVEKLPKDIDKLQHLETLDIRQTKIDASASKATLPTKLKHLLAGCPNCPRKDAIRSKEAFSTVCMPHGIRYMTKLQILSHVDVSNNVNELMDVGKLKQLRKLGVVLHGKEDHIKSLLQAIEMLNECLRSLSVRIEPPAHENNYENQSLNSAKLAFLPPKSLESLNISGRITGLPTWIKELHQLSKITLCGTDLRHGELFVLAALDRLRCLRLRDNSYTEDKLTFKDREFKSLKYLVVEVSTISTIQFENGAVPKLEKIVWAFTEMKTLSGLENLNNLKEIELIGKCDTWRRIIEEMAAHPNHPAVTHHPIREAAATSNTSIQE